MNPTATMPPNSSLVSDCASSASPSRATSLFLDWTDRAKVVLTVTPPVGVVDHFDKLYQLEQVPKILVEGPFPTSFLHDEPEFQSRVKKWASTLRTVDQDEFGILTALPTLAFAFNRSCKTSNKRSKEHAQRRGIDDIIELAFSARRDRHCDFATEESYRLVASLGNPDAVSDTLVTIPSETILDIIGEGRLSFQYPSLSEHLYWSTGRSTDGFSIIGLAGEFKKDENGCNKNQVIMALATAQAQRKALGLQHSIIMGAIASCGHVQILSSYRKSENSLVYIYAHKQLFDLSNPSHLVHLYVFFSKLERDFQGSLALELETWSIPMETAIWGHQWRSPEHSRKHCWTDAGEGGNAGNRGGAGNGGLVDVDGFNGGPEDVDGFDGDQYMDIMNWRDEVVKDGKADRVVYDEDNILGML